MFELLALSQGLHYLLWRFTRMSLVSNSQRKDYLCHLLAYPKTVRSWHPIAATYSYADHGVLQSLSNTCRCFFAGIVF